MEEVTLIGNHSTNINDEWMTPPEYIRSAKKVFGGSIDLDPATSLMAQELIRAGLYYTVDNPGLNQNWYGKVWMNPPYSRKIKDFAHHLVDQYRSGNVAEAIVLTNNGTDTRWFHELASVASAVCLPKGRIGFLDPNGTPVNNNNKGQIFTYIGPHPSLFEEEFSQYGIVLRK